MERYILDRVCMSRRRKIASKSSEGSEMMRSWGVDCVNSVIVSDVHT